MEMPTSTSRGARGHKLVASQLHHGPTREMHLSFIILLVNHSILLTMRLRFLSEIPYRKYLCRGAWSRFHRHTPLFLSSQFPKSSLRVEPLIAQQSHYRLPFTSSAPIAVHFLSMSFYSCPAFLRRSGVGSYSSDPPNGHSQLSRSPLRHHNRRYTFGPPSNMPSPLSQQQEWCKRQRQKAVLAPQDIIPLSMRWGSPRCATPRELPRRLPRHEHTLADVFLSCSADVPDRDALLRVFLQLSLPHQLSIFAKAFQNSRAYPSFPVTEALDLVIGRIGCSSTACRDLLSAMQPSLSHSSPSALRYLVSNACQLKRDAFESDRAARIFFRHTLALLEASISTSAISSLLLQCGLTFEACAYASSESNFVDPPLDIDYQSLSCGPEVLHICTLPMTSQADLVSLSHDLTPPVRRYAAQLLLRARLRRLRECPEADLMAVLTTDDTMTPLEAASSIHFQMGEGCAATAHLLLPACHTALQLLTLAQYTTNVGTALSFQILRRLLNFPMSRRSVVLLRLSRCRSGARDAHLLFDCQLHPSDFMQQKEAPYCPDVGPDMMVLPASWGRKQQALLYRILRDTIPPFAYKKSEASLAQLLSAVPPSAVPFVVRSLPHFHVDVLSWWASLYTRAGQIDGALAVLHVAAEGGYTPHMTALVELLEAIRGDRTVFSSVVNWIADVFPPVADSVFRASMERAVSAAMASCCDNDGAMPVAAAEQLFSSLAIMGLFRFPASFLEEMTRSSAPAVVEAAVRMLQTPTAAPRMHACGVGVAATLSIDTVEGLCTAAERLGYTVVVDVVIMEGGGGEGERAAPLGWWSSKGRSTSTLVDHIYRHHLVCLWPLLRADCITRPPRTSIQAHKMLRIFALGNQDVQSLIQLIHRVAPQLIRSAVDKGRRSRRGRARTQLLCADTELASTIAFLSTVQDSWNMGNAALQILLSLLEDSGMQDLRHQLATDHYSNCPDVEQRAQATLLLLSKVPRHVRARRRQRLRLTTPLRRLIAVVKRPSETRC